MAEPLTDTQQASWRAFIESSLGAAHPPRGRPARGHRPEHGRLPRDGRCSPRRPGTGCGWASWPSRLVFSPSRLTYQISSMVKRGLVRKQPCPDDGRGQEAVLTAAGLAALRAAAPLHLATVRDNFIDHLDDDELAVITRVFDRISPPAAHRYRCRRERPVMPAITVDDVLVLPRLPRLDPATTAYRPVRRLTTAPSGFEGEGFPVRRAFAGVPLTELDPFIHLDQMGEVDYAPGEPKGTPWHPHRGFETVTYMIDGIMDHQDSNGGGGTITNGDTQWMTAGGGILHIEAPPEHLVDQRRPVPRPAALGQPAPGGEDDPAALPGHPRPGGGAAHHAGRRRADPGHRRRGRRARRARAPRTPRSPSRTSPCSPAPSSTCPGSRTTTRWSTCSPAAARSAPTSARSRSASSPCTAPATRIRVTADAAQDSQHPGASTCSSWAASRSASRWRTTARS